MLRVRVLLAGGWWALSGPVLAAGACAPPGDWRSFSASLSWLMVAAAVGVGGLAVARLACR